MVWTPQQTGQFLDDAVNDPLYPLFHLIAHVGLRRGEACGQRRADTYLDAATIEVANQIVQYGWGTARAAPKTTSSEGLVALDGDTVLVLGRHLANQDLARARLGPDRIDSGLLSARPDGSPLHPADVTARFQKLVRQAGLPPIRFHDLRGDAGARCRRGHESRAEHAPAFLDHSDRRHLHHRAARSCRGDGQDHPSGGIMTARARCRPLWTLIKWRKTCGNQKIQFEEIFNLGSEGAPSGTRTPKTLVKRAQPGLSDGVA